MQKIKQLWLNFVNKYPKLSVWVREGGLFIIVSNLITIFKYLILTFLPAAFAFMGNRDFGFPGIDLTLLGVEFKWYIIGYGAEQGGVSYFTAYMIAMVIGEVINFFIQRKYVFRSNGNIAYQGAWYLLAFSTVSALNNTQGASTTRPPKQIAVKPNSLACVITAILLLITVTSFFSAKNSTINCVVVVPSINT